MLEVDLIARRNRGRFNGRYMDDMKEDSPVNEENCYGLAMLCEEKNVTDEFSPAEEGKDGLKL